MKQSSAVAVLVGLIGISFAAVSHASWSNDMPGSACSLVNTSDHHLSPYHQPWYGWLVNDNYGNVDAIATCSLSTQSPDVTSGPPYGVPQHDIRWIRVTAERGPFNLVQQCRLCNSLTGAYNCIFGTASNDSIHDYYTFPTSGSGYLNWSTEPLAIECLLHGRGVIDEINWYQVDS